MIIKFTYLRCAIIQMFSSLMFISFAIIIHFLAENILETNIHNNVMLKNESAAYKIWIEPTKQSTVYRKYYLFNVSNADALVSGREKKPNLVEMGPYVYKEKMEKKDVSFVDEETVRYSPVTTLIFDSNLSNGTLDQHVTFLNVPAWGLVETSLKGKFKDLTAEGINIFFKLYGTKIFETKTVQELISGYKDPLLTLGKIFTPNIVKDDTFSMINGKNATIFEHYSMNTGVFDMYKIGKLQTFNDKTKIDIWGHENADTLKGSDGTIFAPSLKKDTILFAFNPDMCRSYELQYLRENIVKGVKTLDFHLPENIFYNSTLNPLNEGFCNGDCLGNGVQNISRCYGGISSFISQPHFLNADKMFTDALIGMSPDKDKHDLILSFEPITGVPITGSVKFMISFYYHSNPLIDIIKNLEPTVLPMLWFEEAIALNDDITNQLKNVRMIADICYATPIVMIALGLILFFVSLAMFFKHFIDKNKNEKIKTQAVSSNNLNDDIKTIVSVIDVNTVIIKDTK